MSAKDDYEAALSRLKANKPNEVPKGTAINKDSVALEAGKKRGSIRNRPGFEQLIADIELAGKNKAKRTNKKTTSDQIASREIEIEKLKKENEILKTRYMSLLYQNYELANLIQKSGLKVPKLGRAQSISIMDESLA